MFNLSLPNTDNVIYCIQSKIWKLKIIDKAHILTFAKIAWKKNPIEFKKTFHMTKMHWKQDLSMGGKERVEGTGMTDRLNHEVNVKKE